MLVIWLLACVGINIAMQWVMMGCDVRFWYNGVTDIEYFQLLCSVFWICGLFGVHWGSLNVLLQAPAGSSSFQHSSAMALQILILGFFLPGAASKSFPFPAPWGCVCVKVLGQLLCSTSGLIFDPGALPSAI